MAQLREAYQSQLSIQQNDLMKIFTVVTAVFLPLTLLDPKHPHPQLASLLAAWDAQGATQDAAQG